MLFDEPLRTARSKQQGVWFEVYRIPRGADLYVPDPFAWRAPPQDLPATLPDAVESPVWSLAACRDWSHLCRPTAANTSELAKLIQQSRALRRQSHALYRRGARVSLAMHELTRGRPVGP